MERTNNKILKLVLITLLLFHVSIIMGQESACFFKETYAIGDLSGWEPEIRKMEIQHSQNFEVMAEALLARYGLMGYLIGSRQNSKAKSLLDETEKLLEAWLKRKPGNARLLSIKAGLVGFRIGLSPMRAPFLGQRNVDAWEEALQNDPAEAMGWLEKGNSLFYRPAMFGGDKKEAEASFRKALQLSEARECDWLYSFIQVRLYESCKANGKTSEAETIRKQLQEKPGYFKWIEKL